MWVTVIRKKHDYTFRGIYSQASFVVIETMMKTKKNRRIKGLHLKQFQPISKKKILPLAKKAPSWS